MDIGYISQEITHKWNTNKLERFHENKSICETYGSMPRNEFNLARVRFGCMDGVVRSM